MARKREAVRHGGEIVRQNYKLGDGSAFLSIRESPINEEIHCRIHPDEKQRYVKAAERIGISLSRFIRELFADRLSRKLPYDALVAALTKRIYIYIKRPELSSPSNINWIDGYERDGEWPDGTPKFKARLKARH